MAYYIQCKPNLQPKRVPAESAPHYDRPNTINETCDQFTWQIEYASGALAGVTQQGSAKLGGNKSNCCYVIQANTLCWGTPDPNLHIYDMNDRDVDETTSWISDMSADGQTWTEYNQDAGVVNTLFTIPVTTDPALGTDGILTVNVPIFEMYRDGITYTNTGVWENAINIVPDDPYADWLVGYTNSEDTVYSVACDVPLFSDPDSDFYGKGDIASIDMTAVYYYGESIITIYRNQYPYGQTWQGQLSDLIGQSDMSIANQIATKVASIMDLDNIMLQFQVNLNDGSGHTARGYVEFDHNHVDDYGFSTESHGDTISFRAGEILADSDSDTTNPEHEKEESDPTPTEVLPDIQGAGLLTRTYVLTPQEAQGVGQFMWGASFMQNILLLNQSPIENVVSCKLFPLELSGSVANVKVGNVDTGTAGQVTSDNLIIKTSNSLSVAEHFTDNLRFLNYAPYTKIEIFLPFIGFKELPVDLVMGNNIKLVWVIDLVTGTLQTNIHITIDNVERHLYTFNSNIGIDIPLTAQNMAQIGSAFIQNVIGGGLGLASGIATGNAVGAVGSVVSSTANIATTQYHSQTTGTPSPNTAVVACLEPYLVITHPTCEDVGGTNRSTFKKLRGAPCYRAMKLGELKGYTVIDKPDVVVDGATLRELEEINRLLAEGVYFGDSEE